MQIFHLFNQIFVIFTFKKHEESKLLAKIHRFYVLCEFTRFYLKFPQLHPPTLTVLNIVHFIFLLYVRI